MCEGFSEVEVSVEGAVIRAHVGGKGPPLLLLHGYPQTHAMWHGVIDDLASDHTVVAPDLRGYGASRARSSDFTFRAMAADQVAVMEHLGYERFHVVAHDRGARVAHRLLLDQPQVVHSVALADILPTLDVWARMDADLSMRYYHWTFLAQPGGLPERLISAAPVTFLHAALAGLSGPRDIFAPEALADYEKAACSPSVVAAWCGDYAAAATTDREHDRVDLGRAIDVPALVLWGAKGVLETLGDPLEIWRPWLPQVIGGSLDAGHFIVEERPEEFLDWLRPHLAAAGSSAA